LHVQGFDVIYFKNWQISSHLLPNQGTIYRVYSDLKAIGTTTYIVLRPATLYEKRNTTDRMQHKIKTYVCMTVTPPFLFLSIGTHLGT
jgi:hypothetical protein